MSASCSPVRIFSHENGLYQELNHKVGIRGEFQDPNVKQPSSSSNEGSSNSKEEDHVLESAKAEMGEVREENERLKKMLQRVEKDYQSLKLRFFEILQQESCKNNSAGSSNEDTEESELVSLSLGRTSTSPPSELAKKLDQEKAPKDHDQEDFKASLTLGLDSKFPNSKNPSPTNSSEQQQEQQEVVLKEGDEGGDSRPPTKLQKINNVADDEVAQPNNPKRARVCVRARCDTPTMNDGCQWRKYGQKISKGNPCPRAYYRCTVAPLCPVRKQVQRCSDDMSILITTYEGTHNHQLPVSATAMASTTSAAASMLLSGSSTSQSGLPAGTSSASSNFNLNADSTTNQHFYLPNHHSSPLFPTITLDLTSPPNNHNSPSLNRFSSSSRFNHMIPSSNLSFSSSDHQSYILPTIWGNGYHSNNHNVPQIHLQRNNVHQPQQALTETLTKAITSDPSFRTVIAAALSSMMGSTGSGSGSSSTSTQILVEPSSGPNEAAKGKGCGPISNYFNGLTQTGKTTNLDQSNSTAPFCIFNSASASAVNKDHKS